MIGFERGASFAALRLDLIHTGDVIALTHARQYRSLAHQVACLYVAPLTGGVFLSGDRIDVTADFESQGRPYNELRRS